MVCRAEIKTGAGRTISLWQRVTVEFSGRALGGAVDALNTAHLVEEVRCLAVAILSNESGLVG